MMMRNALILWIFLMCICLYKHKIPSLYLGCKKVSNPKTESQFDEELINFSRLLRTPHYPAPSARKHKCMFINIYHYLSSSSFCHLKHFKCNVCLNIYPILEHTVHTHISSGLVWRIDRYAYFSISLFVCCLHHFFSLHTVIPQMGE